MSEAKLIIKIENKQPVEIVDFTESFKALGGEYYKYLSESPNFKLNKETKLYVTEITTGSIITVLSDMVPAVLPFVENSNSVIEFATFLKSGFTYFLDKSKPKPREFDIADCNNFNNIIKPVAKDNGSQILFTGDFKDSNVTFNFSSVEANAIQNGIRIYKSELKEPDSSVKEKVLFYWDTAKYTNRSMSVDRGRIDSLCDKALKVIFDLDGQTKAGMIAMNENPFHYIFIVDVEVLTVNNIPAVYKIKRLHEAFPNTSPGE